MSLFKIDDTKNIAEQFQSIAEELIKKHELVVNDARFNFTEIEFYYMSTDESHLDIFTHYHEYEPGKWRFHNVGFDITIRGKNGFGGILIRGVERVNFKCEDEKDNFVNGPRRVIFEMFRHLKGVGAIDNAFGLVKVKQQNDDKPIIYWTYREGLNENIPTNKVKKKLNDIHRGNLPDGLVEKVLQHSKSFRDKKYRCIAKRKGEKYPSVKGKEKIAEGFSKDDKKEFLNYKRNQ